MPVKNAFVERLGTYSEERISSLTEADWQHIRTTINYMQERTGAYCLDCNDPVMVRALGSEYKTPHFTHFSGGGMYCPWGEDRGRAPDQIRASIYGGNQESETHRKMCEKILRCASLDQRYEQSSGGVDEYHKPVSGGHGRWPDVRFEFGGLGKFAIEVQLAPSLPTEVVGRSKYYLNEGIHLIWIVPKYSRDLVRRAFTRDIAQEAGGNLFVFDQEALAASEERRTLILWAIWHGSNGYDERLITLDDLQLRKDRHPYVIDVVTGPIFEEAGLRRHELIQRLYDSYGEPVTVLHPVTGARDEHYDRLIRVLLSIWYEAQGEWRNLLNGQPNITALLNPYLTSANGMARARIVFEMLKKTRAGSKVKDTVWRKVTEGLSSSQIGIDDPTISEAISLFPEVFRDDLRGEPLRVELLPDWAVA